jgi:hypothetical protein
MRFLHNIYGKRLAVALIFISICLQTSAFQADTGQALLVGEFSAVTPSGPLPAGWKPLTFKKIKNHTNYSLVQENGVVVVKAQSSSAASGLIHKIRIDPAEYPVVTWRWKIANILEKGDVTQKSGDDYPARLYITFQYDPAGLSFSEKIKYEAARLFYGEYPPAGAINYIWASKAPKGTVVPNPYTDRVMMIVVQSGSSGLDTWIDEKRNIAEDFHKAFGQKPPLISSVAIMTDTDNTKESATAYYGDIVFRKQ